MTSVPVELPGASFNCEFDRPALYGDDQKKLLGVWVLEGARRREDWDHLTDEQAEKELAVTCRHPEEKATYAVVGLANKPYGFLAHTEPFATFTDPALRNNFRVIADSVLDGAPTGHRPNYYDPLLTARRGFYSTNEYDDGVDRVWDRDTVYSQMVLAMTERGVWFPDNDHLDKSLKHIYAAGTLFRMLRLAYDLGQRDDFSEEVRQRVEKLIKEDHWFVDTWSHFGNKRIAKAANTVNELAGIKLLGVAA